MARYLVTGGAGFIGSNLVGALADEGHAVTVCDRLGGGEKWRNLAKHALDDIVIPERMRDWLAERGAGLDGVLHMGAITDTMETDADAIVENNIRLTLDLWEWCAREGKPFLYASSAATYGDGAAGFDDMTSLAGLLPLNAYGWSKHAVDRRLTAAVRRGARTPPQWVGLKFFNVYGPNEYHKGAMQSVVARQAGAVARGEAIRLFKSYNPAYPDGGQKRDFVYVRDCVDVVRWFLAHPEKSGLFNLGTGRARSWLDLAGAMFAAVGKPLNVSFVDMPETLRPKYQCFTEAKMEKLRAAGYAAPFTSLEDGVADYLRTYLLTADPYR